MHDIKTWSVEVVGRSARAGIVLLADRGFTGFALWQQAAVTGAELLWRAKNNNVTPRQIEVLTDGSWLGEMDSPTPG